ncbi:T-cell activation inhibitor, mitochondrial isoform X2 [Tachypleus tridentatus]|uniref:T-cell activation inhibitor, mitochondrial isoform X2 n=1 Tax=Tachypleus tridentatus TaxID=6853 RepID=UPI003FD57AC0
MFLRRIVRLAIRVRTSSSFHTYKTKITSLTTQEVSTALRPFYFSVHPDLFWQHPAEKEVNENSLKQLNQYLEGLLQSGHPQQISLTFYLRDPKSELVHDTSRGKFRTVKIHLYHKDIHSAVHSVLSTCSISTKYLDNITHSQLQSSLRTASQPPVAAAEEEISFSFQNDPKQNEYWWGWKFGEDSLEEVEEKLHSEPEIGLRGWLRDNINKARSKLEKYRPLREETERLRNDLKERLTLKNIIWDCGWGSSHFRGCLLSFQGLAAQHSKEMEILKVWKYDNYLEEVPATERALSEVLRGIQIDHRKFQPAVMVQKYIQQLRKLTSALYKYRWQKGFPDQWPRRLTHFKLVVECEAGPLMLSPTGQFIAPASCPPFVLVDFISKNMSEADQKLKLYEQMKAKECEMYGRCLAELGLASLEKDDNVTPDLMVECCQKLLENSPLWATYLWNCRLRISQYYCVLQDGEICIPWYWEGENCDL